MNVNLAYKFQRFTKSTALILVLLLLSAEFFMFNITCEHKKLTPGLASNDDRIPAIRKAIETEHSDAVLLGSSLMITAFAYPDFNLGLTPMNQLNSEYVQSRLLSKLLKEKTGKNFRVTNLSCVAATPADALLIAKELAARGKLPPVVIYGIEPRAIADNLTPLGGALGGSAALELDSKFKRLEAWTPSVLRKSWLELQVKLGRLGEKPKPEESQDVILSHCWQTYAARQIIQAELQRKFLALLPIKSKTATTQTKSASNAPNVTCVPPSDIGIKTISEPKPKLWDRVSPARLEKQMTQYRVHYSPPNKEKMAKNDRLLQRLAEICQTNGSQLFLVAMPLATENAVLVPQETAAGYEQALNDTHQKYACKIVDLRAGFEDGDFMDTVHLNAKGGEKFQRKLARAIGSQIE